jgi:hypothetical protein
MITPAPTSRIAPSLARGTLVEHLPETATRPSMVVLSFPNTSYQTHLIPGAPIGTEPGKRIVGTIHARARRIDRVVTGGRYIEPVFGRPRRVQGSVIGHGGEGGNELIVDATVPIHITPMDPRQKAADFAQGDFVSFDVMEGATFRAQGDGGIRGGTGGGQG